MYMKYNFLITKSLMPIKSLKTLVYVKSNAQRLTYKSSKICNFILLEEIKEILPINLDVMINIRLLGFDQSFFSTTPLLIIIHIY